MQDNRHVIELDGTDDPIELEGAETAADLAVQAPSRELPTDGSPGEVPQ